MRSKNINFVSHYFHNYFQLLTFTNHSHYIHYFFLFSFSYICMLESVHCYTFRRFKNYTWKIDHSISHNPKRVIIKKFSFFFLFLHFVVPIGTVRKCMNRDVRKRDFDIPNFSCSGRAKFKRNVPLNYEGFNPNLYNGKKSGRFFG